MAYERRIDAVLDRLEAVRKPTVALVEGVAMGSGFAIAASCDLRVMHAGRDVRHADRAHGRQLPLDGQLRAAGGGARRAAAEGRDLPRAPDRGRRGARDGFASAVVEDAEARVARLCALLAEHSPTTLWVTKEALRRAPRRARGRRPDPRGVQQRRLPPNVGGSWRARPTGSERGRANGVIGDGEPPGRRRLRRRGADPDRRRATASASARREKRARRERILLWLCAPLLLPAAGAAAAVAVLEGEGRGPRRLVERRRSRSCTAAVFGVPAAPSAWLARRRGRIEPLGWAAITLLAQIALVFWVGLRRARIRSRR